MDNFRGENVCEIDLERLVAIVIATPGSRRHGRGPQCTRGSGSGGPAMRRGSDPTPGSPGAVLARSPTSSPQRLRTWAGEVAYEGTGRILETRIRICSLNKKKI